MRRILERSAILALLLIVLGDLAVSTGTLASGVPMLDECGHDHPDSIKLQLIAAIIDVPEFHDCQRLIVRKNGALRYEGMTAVFASQALGNFEADMRRRYVATTGNAANTTIAAPPPNAPAPNLVQPGVEGASAIPVAIVLAERGYDALRIKPGLNCLYIWFTVNVDTTWLARMVATDSTAGCPSVVMQPTTPNLNLEVKRRRVIDPVDGVPFTAQSDYPSVARWDWDSIQEQHYISIGCGIAWCEVGAPGFASSPPLQLVARDITQKAFRRVKLIRGWYDQQLLATHGALGDLAPSTVTGTIVPDTSLGSADDLSKPVHVADVTLQSAAGGDGVVATYDAKFNFGARILDLPARIDIQASANPASNLWTAQIRRRASGSYEVTKNKKVMFRPVSSAFKDAGYKVPGVARWRWMVTDEGTWTRCKYGCCEISNY